MRCRLPAFCLIVLFGAVLRASDDAAAGAAQAPVDATRLAGYDPNGGDGKTVYDVPIEGTIDLGLAAFVERVVGLAKAGDVIVLHVKTFGGRVDAAVRIRDALLDAKAKTVAYVDRRAISAGALITLACDTILMSPGASIGAATPVQGGSPGEAPETASEKVVSYMRAEMRATAEAKGRRGDLAEAMVDPDIEIPDVTLKGKLLTLTGERAVELKLADAIVDGPEAAIALLNLGGAKREHSDTHWGEKLARFLTDPLVSSLLMTFGMLGLLMELYTPGFGVAGIVGLTCLVLFFTGQYAANLAGWEELVIFAVGAALLLLEIFVIPGFGVAGISGLVLMAVGLVMALTEIDLPWDVAFELGYIQEAISSAAWRILVVCAALLLGTFVFGKYFPRSTLGGWLVLKAATTAQEGYVSEPLSWQSLVGKHGRALSTLRPAGIAEIEGKRVDVVTEGDYIEANSEIEVAQVDGNRVVVRRIG